MYSSGHALPDPNRRPNLVSGSMSKDWDNICHRKVQLFHLLSSLEQVSQNSALAGKIEGGKLTNYSVDPTEQKEIIDLDSDNEDGNSSAYNKLASGVNKGLITSQVAGNITERMVSCKSQAFETMHAYGDKNMQTVP